MLMFQYIYSYKTYSGQVTSYTWYLVYDTRYDMRFLILIHWHPLVVVREFSRRKTGGFVFSQPFYLGFSFLHINYTYSRYNRKCPMFPSKHQGTLFLGVSLVPTTKYTPETSTSSRR